MDRLISKSVCKQMIIMKSVNSVSKIVVRNLEKAYGQQAPAQPYEHSARRFKKIET